MTFSSKIKSIWHTRGGTCRCPEAEATASYLDFFLVGFFVPDFFFLAAAVLEVPLLLRFLPALFLVPNAASQPEAYFWFEPTRVIVTVDYLTCLANRISSNT